jgi:hypothetical protein
MVKIDSGVFPFEPLVVGKAPNNFDVFYRICILIEPKRSREQKGEQLGIVLISY